MRKLTGALCLGLFTALAVPAQAAEVAVLDWREALLATDSAQRSMNQLKNQVASQQQEAQSLGQELQQLQQRLQRDGATMSDSQRQAAEQEMRQKGGRFQQLRRQIAEARMASEKQFLQQSQPKLEQAVDQIIDRHGVEVLVDRDGVIHTDDELLDVTDEVTGILNSLN